MKKLSVEQELLGAAKAGNLASIVNIVRDLSAKEKECISTSVFDTVLNSIVRYAEFDRAESAYATMMFIRSVGRYISPAAMNAMLRTVPPAIPVEARAVQPAHRLYETVQSKRQFQ